MGTAGRSPAVDILKLRILLEAVRSLQGSYAPPAFAPVKRSLPAGQAGHSGSLG